MIHCCYYLCTVNDVTAQSCVIGPNLTELSIRNHLQRNVELHCQCLDIIGEVTETWWFSGSNSMITRMDSNRVHSTNTNPSRLIIGAPFTNSDAGVYTCANADTLSSASVSDMITLRAGSEYVCTCIYIYIYVCVYMYISYSTVVLYSRDQYEIIGLRKILHSIKQPCSSICL